LFGGVPAFSESLHVGRPNIPDPQAVLRRIANILETRVLTNDGPYVEEFERRIRELTGARHCVAVCNATAGLGIVARALGMKGEVIVPSFTFIATAHALEWLGITPVFCDIDPETHNIDPSSVEQLITPDTTGIIGVHLWGRPCNVRRLTEIASHHHLHLVFDAAHAFGCSYDGTRIGTFGNAEVFSFHATKLVNSFEGGAVVTDDKALADKIRLMRAFGFASDDKVTHVGTNGKMNEVCAAMGLASLDAMEGFVAVNRRNYHEYRQLLAGLPGIRLVNYDDSQQCTFPYIVLEVDSEVAAITRDELKSVLLAENVLARRYFYPGCHRMEPYSSQPRNKALHLRHTEALCDSVLCLPTGTSIGPREIGKICEVIRLALVSGSAVRARLTGLSRETADAS
jgi:dTDP-4-amino-4,6-dideoxygalactose transaminase